MSTPSEEQIIAALERSGYLFEQEVADKLEQLDFHVETGWAFQDPDQSKSREIDVRAIKRIFNDESKQLGVFIELLIECKASESPFVFLQRSKNEREKKNISPKEYLFPKKNFRHTISPTSFREIPAFMHFDLHNHHYYYREDLKSTQFSKIVRKGNEWVANHEGIYDSIVQPLAKALEYQRKSLKSTISGTGWKYIWLVFPIVVLRDGLFAVDVSLPNLKPEPKGRVSFVRHLQSESVDGFYLIDFIKISHLHQYIEKEIGSFSNEIIRLCQNETVY